MTTPRELSDSPFDTLEETFRLLCSGPRPLALDGSAFAGLPDRLVPLDELKAILLHPSSAFSLRDAIVSELVARAQHDGTWLVGLAGVLLPGLRCAAWPFAQTCPDQEADIESEMLTAFVVAVRRTTPDHPRLAAHLTWRAHARAKDLVRTEMAEWARPALHPVSAAPPRPWGHPDLVLEKAVGCGVLCAEDAELIGATRIGDVALESAASRLGITYAAARKRRIRAEAVLVAWVTSDDYPPFDFVPEAGETPRSVGGGRARQGRPRMRQPEQRRFDPSTRR
ncbi:MAG: hypothetical protein ACYDD4_05150 [Acidimicrobiales bacterium]